ncbi:MAG: radical SAM protein [Deltaproteobacteria bacterium]|nr:radical SAM protein [Deltaproteobacteria bacterium]
MKKIDLLLINASNYPAMLLYPYAFVQVSALARRQGLNVARLDVSTLPLRRAEFAVSHAIRRHGPKAVGFTMRNVDSLLFHVAFPPDGRQGAYQPIRKTAALIKHARTVTEVPILIGGFGFSIDPVVLLGEMEGADIGIRGEPDHLFEHFDEVVHGGRRSDIHNLVYRREDGQVVENERVFYGPLDEPEYDDQLVGELEQFYGGNVLFSDRASPVPVEVARGCPYRCSFCIEPVVKGRQLRRRDLAAVEQDIRLLARHGIRKVFLIASELNIGKDTLLTDAQAMMRRINADMPDLPVVWDGTLLPTKLSRNQVMSLARDHCEMGANGFPAIDDATLRRCQVPYTANDVLEMVETIVMLRERRRYSRVRRMQLFLGNNQIDADGFATTIKALEERGLPARMGAEAPAACRVWEALPKTMPESEEHLWCESVPPMLIYGSYTFAPGLLESFSTPAGIHAFFQFALSTFLTRGHRANKNWVWHLSNVTSPKVLSQILTEASPMILGAEAVAEAKAKAKAKRDSSADLEDDWDEMSSCGEWDDLSSLTSSSDWSQVDTTGPWNELTDSHVELASDSVDEVKALLAAGREALTNRIERLLRLVLLDSDSENLHFLFAPPRLSESSRVVSYSSLASHGENHPNASVVNLLIHQLLMLLVEAFEPRLEKVCKDLGLPLTLDPGSPASEYQIMRRLYARFSSTREIIDYAQERFDLGDDSAEIFLLHTLLYFFNVQIDQRYTPWLFGSDFAGQIGRVEC